MATTAKNFRIKQGLVVEGSTATVNGNNILVETASDQYILDLIGGSNLIDTVASGLLVIDSELSIDRTVVDTWYDAAGAAATAQTNAESYADSLAVNYDAAGAASTAQGNAEDYTDLLIGDVTVDGTGGNTITDRIATAVSDLVGTAPAVLDTLQELALAIGNDVNIVDGIGVAIGNKLPLAGGSMTGNIAMGSNLVTGLGAPSSDNDAARKKYVDDTAATAQTNAESYADGLASNYDAAGAAATAQTNAESYAGGLVNDVLDGTTSFTALNVNNVSGTYAATSTVSTSGTATAWSFDSAIFTSAKLLVKFKTATHSQVSELLLTLDASGNIALTEFAEVGTNGSLGTVTAINNSGIVNIRVTTAYNATDVMVYATTLI